MSQAVVSVNVGVLLPILAPAVGAAVVLVTDVAVQHLRRAHYLIALASVVVGSLGTLTGLGMVAGGTRRTLCLPGAGGQCLYVADSVVSTLQLAALLAAGLTLLLSWPDDKKERPGSTAVIVSLVLAATAGATAVAGARDLGSWLVALELATLPTVALVALRGARTAISGAIALLTASLVSFALLAFSAALWFTATGSGFLTQTAALAGFNDPVRRPILVLAVVVAIAGVGFKLSLVPFHAWTPESYDGAPLPMAAFLAGVSKIAALGALLVMIRAIPIGEPPLAAIAIVAAVSMTLGNIMALRQNGVVRLLAWSTVAQAGWVVLPLAALSSAAVKASGAYLLAYVLATLLAFAVVAALVQIRGAARARDLGQYRGLLRDHPVLASALGLALLSLAGLPPGFLGLVAKVAALRPVVTSELWLLAIVAAVNAVLGVAVYLRWLLTVVSTRDATAQALPPAVPQETGSVVQAVKAHPATLAAVGLTAVGLVLTSLNPQMLLGMLGQ